MLGTIISAVTAFAATNMDDIFVLMLFFAREERIGYKKYIVMGQYVGIGTLILVSLLGGVVLGFLPGEYLGLLGLLPIALGIREWISYRRQSASERDDDAAGEEIDPAAGGCLLSRVQKRVRPEIVSVALVTIANGGDNIGVYTPLFAGASPMEKVVMILVFLVLVSLWCALGQRLAALPVLRRVIRRYRHILVPVVLVLLGVYILLGSGLV